MTFSEACEATVTKSEAIAEIEAHSASVSEFLTDCGDNPKYKGQTILSWLGY